jgi:hypothetical protein
MISALRMSTRVHARITRPVVSVARLIGHATITRRLTGATTITRPLLTRFCIGGGLFYYTRPKTVKS